MIFFFSSFRSSLHSILLLRIFFYISCRFHELWNYFWYKFVFYNFCIISSLSLTYFYIRIFSTCCQQILALIGSSLRVSDAVSGSEIMQKRSLRIGRKGGGLVYFCQNFCSDFSYQWTKIYFGCQIYIYFLNLLEKNICMEEDVYFNSPPPCPIYSGYASAKWL